MIDIHEYAAKQSENQAEILIFLHDVICTYPGVHTKIAYRIPFFYRKSWLCYTNPTKDGGVELSFTRGNELLDIDNILDCKGRKQIKGITYFKLSDINEEQLFTILEEAVELDETVKYNVRKVKKNH